MGSFDTDQFIADCISTLHEADPIDGLLEVVGRAISVPADLNSWFTVPIDQGDDGILLRRRDLLISSALFPSGFSTGIHNHTVPAVIGVWTGAEDNYFYQRTPTGIAPLPSRRIEAGQVLALDRETIHDVHVSTRSWSGALHVYLGDILEADRSEWSDQNGPESPFDGEQQERRWSDAARRTGLLAT